MNLFELLSCWVMVSLRWWYTCFHPTLSFASSIGFDLIGSHFYLPLRHYSLYENRIYRNENEKIQKSQRDLSESNKPCFSVNQDNSGISSPKSVEQLALAGGSPGLWHGLEWHAGRRTLIAKLVCARHSPGAARLLEAITRDARTAQPAGCSLHAPHECTQATLQSATPGLCN